MPGFGTVLGVAFRFFYMDVLNYLFESAGLLAEANDYDSAISRAYYAAFYLPEVLLDTLGQSFSSHRAVISAYGKEFTKSGIHDPRFHRMLIGAFEKRQQAYLPESRLTSEDIAKLLDEVRQFNKAANEWLRNRYVPTRGRSLRTERASG